MAKEELITLLDSKLRITEINDHLEEFIGIKKEEIKNKDFFDTFMLEIDSRFGRNYYKKSIENRTLRNKDEQYWINKDFEHRMIAWENSLIFDENNNIAGIKILGKDITEERIFRELQEEAIPNHIDFQINSDCTRCCDYCPISNEQNASPKYMEEELFYKCVDELAELDYSHFVHYNHYGEPLLDRRILKFCSYVSSKLPKAKSILYTNGDLLTHDYFKELVDSGFAHITVTLHDNFVPDHIQNVIDNLTDREKELEILTVQMQNEMYMDNRRDINVEIDENFSDIPKKSIKNRPCFRPAYAMTITHNGKVVPCCIAYGDKYFVGDVSKDGLLGVWRSQKFKDLRKEIAKGNRSYHKLCKDCDNVLFGASIEYFYLNVYSDNL